MGRNYYDILGISSPEMRKHFKATDKAIEDLKNNMEIVSKLSSAFLVNDETLTNMSVAEIEEQAAIKPIMLIDTTFNNSINLMWLSTIKKDLTILGESAVKLIFENDYCYAEMTKYVNSGDITQYYPILKEKHEINRILLGKSDFVKTNLTSSTGASIECYVAKVKIDNPKSHIYRLGIYASNDSGIYRENFMALVNTLPDKMKVNEYTARITNMDNGYDEIVITITKETYTDTLDLYSLVLTVL